MIPRRPLGLKIEVKLIKFSTETESKLFVFFDTAYLNKYLFESQLIKGPDLVRT